MITRFYSFLFFVLCPFVVFPSIFINEMMVKNVSNHVNGNFNFEGWVELYNSGADIVNLSNYHFSEDQGNPLLWQYQGDMDIAPNGFASFYFDELDSLNHTSFKLDSDGGILILNDEAGNLVDFIRYPEPFLKFFFFCSVQ